MFRSSVKKKQRKRVPCIVSSLRTTPFIKYLANCAQMNHVQGICT